ncbi:Spy/CpxP family protein refolding chaperone [Pontibacter locisalis]|uniref:Spy/CpxP family protein refolding chaperone n=1 Tax=Pontibacter locisalis TaxID=1719035 RepID=A0ABW5INR8_9BACT
MKRFIILLFFCLITLGSSVVVAQDRSENVEAAKIAYITDKIELSPDQAQKFWPIYNEYETKRRELMRNYRGGYRRDLEEVSEQEANARLNEMFETKERELALEKEYVAKYQKVLSAKQVIKLYRAEREFTKLLLKRLDHRRANK